MIFHSPANMNCLPAHDGRTSPAAQARHFLAVALLAALAGCGKPAPNAATAPRPPQPVGVVTIQPKKVEIETELPGRTASYRVAEVRPQVSGIILKRLFEEGGDVVAGQQLYQIDPAPYQAALDSAAASVERARASVQVAELNANRIGKLAGRSVVSQQESDDAAATLKQARAELAAAQAATATARINLEYTKVLSPISGTIGRSLVTEGALVTAQQTNPLAVINQLDPIYVDVTQSSSNLLRLKQELGKGTLKSGSRKAAARLILDANAVDAGADRQYAEQGTLEFSEVTVDEETNSVTLRAIFPNPRKDLLPGMFVRTVVSVGSVDDALLVPQRGVTRDQKGRAVAMVVGAGNKVEPRILETSRSIGSDWLVTSGLAPGDKVIVEGLQKAMPGQEIVPAEIGPNGSAGEK